MLRSKLTGGEEVNFVATPELRISFFSDEDTENSARFDSAIRWWFLVQFRFGRVRR